LHDRDCEVGSDTRLRYCTAPQVHRPGRLQQTSTDVYQRRPTSTADVYQRLPQTSTDVYRRLPQTSTDVYRRLPQTSTDPYQPHRHGCVRKSSAQLLFATMTLWKCAHISCHVGTRSRLILRESPITFTYRHKYQRSLVASEAKALRQPSHCDWIDISIPRLGASLYVPQIHRWPSRTPSILLPLDVTLFTALTLCCSRF